MLILQLLLTGMPKTQVVLEQFLIKEIVDHAGLIHQSQLWVQDTVLVLTLDIGKNSHQFQWLTVQLKENKEMDVMEVQLLMLTNMLKITVWLPNLVSLSQLHVGLLVDQKDVKTQEMILQSVTHMIHVPLMKIIIQYN